MQVFASLATEALCTASVEMSSRQEVQLSLAKALNVLAKVRTTGPCSV